MRRIFIIIFSIIVVICIALFILKYTEEKIDRFNPLVKRHWSYAKVPNSEYPDKLSTKEIEEIQDYKDIESFDENGEKNSYLLDFKGFNPSEKYVKIDHKGKWVFFIDYISKTEYEKRIQQ